MKRVDKIKFFLSWLLRVLLVVAIFFALLNYNWINLVLAVFTLVLTFLPSIIEKRIKIDYPSEFEILISVFILASLYLGEIHSFYHVFWWWDLMLHTFSGVIIGIIGFSLVNILNVEKKTTLKLSPAFVAFFSFSFAISIGVMWEIFEFFMDTTFGFNMQKSGLVDTMWDLIVDALGAFVISAIGYFYLKKDITIVERIGEIFLKIKFFK